MDILKLAVGCHEAANALAQEVGKRLAHAIPPRRVIEAIVVMAIIRRLIERVVGEIMDRLWAAAERQRRSSVLTLVRRAP